MDANLMIRVLGPIDVLGRHGAVTVGGRRQRALVGALAIAAGHAVPADHLVAVLWGDAPPRSATSTLQSYVSSVRHVLGADVILRTDHSYELDLHEVQIDAIRFERLVRQAEASRARPVACRDLTREALDLWRGRPFGDLADEEPFVLEACRLDELRLFAMELGLDADLALGHHELIVGELESAVREHPYRERLWYLLIEALARDGRRVEALRTCHDLRAVLAEVGVDVASPVSELERAILAGQLGATRIDRFAGIEPGERR